MARNRLKNNIKKSLENNPLQKRKDSAENLKTRFSGKKGVAGTEQGSGEYRSSFTSNGAYKDRAVTGVIRPGDGAEVSKSTLKKDNDTYVTTINAPNLLHQFASYTSLFTLSGMSQDDLISTTQLLNSKPHDVILRSSGIGPTEKSERQVLSPDNTKTIEGNKRLQGAIEKSRTVLSSNRDLYIRNVTLNSIPGLNEKRRLTSVTEIVMEIVEPAGITLLERIRGAAINNGYLDHLDAPFLLTIDFKGFDELGQQATTSDTQNMKRLIPIKIVTMEMNVTQAGTVYTVKAMPYNEFAYVNRHNYPRTAGQLQPIGRKLSDVFVALEELLNKQNEDEKAEGQVEKPDIYTITFDSGESGIRDVELPMENIESIGMASQGVTGSDGGFYVGGTQEIPPDYMKINSSNAITKILEEIMKGHPDYADKRFKQWKQKVSKIASQSRGGPSQVAEEVNDFYFDYFKIRASVVPTTQFDNIRAMNVKQINFHVEPYKIHAYSSSVPGVSTGRNFKNFVFKTYNYIFTGDNIDVMDLSIDYKVAYFQSRLKDFENTNDRKNTIVDASDKSTGATDATDHNQDGNLLTRSYPNRAKAEGTGKTGGTSTQLDSFLDSLTHPLADMVNIRMEVLGDPAWISQSQFIPLNASNFAPGTGTGTDPDIGYWRTRRNRIWNDDLQCYNTDVAEPIIMLNFRMPTDLNDQTGVYDLQTDQSAEFSGLYRVVQVEHNFTDGKYTNVLNLVRFNNQGVIISNPVPTASITDKDGVPTVTLRSELTKYYSAKNLTNIKSNLTSIGKKYIDLASANVSRIKNKAINKIKGFIS